MIGSKSNQDEVFARRDTVAREGLADLLVFQALLRQERLRADRGGKEFSLVTFELRGSRPRNAELARFTTWIRQEMRAIDEAGWLNDATLGVLLPSTRPEGGKAFAQRVAKGMPDGAALPYNVFSYPGNWLPQSTKEEMGERNGRHAGSSRKLSSPGSNEGCVERWSGFENAFCPQMPGWKRCLDITGSLLGLIILSPLMFALAAYIKVASPGPVLFKQERLGRGRKPFKFLKFRTMKIGNNEAYHRDHIKAAIRGDNAMAKLDDRGDPRIIPGGRLLRRACIDELPQLMNILRGDMSLVGPRPCLEYEAIEFLRWHTHRFDTTPGLTGLWQVSGKNKLTFSQMIRLDISYSQNMSLLLDMKIILLTPVAIVKMVLESVAKRMNPPEPATPAEVETEATAASN